MINDATCPQPCSAWVVRLDKAIVLKAPLALGLAGGRDPALVAMEYPSEIIAVLRSVEADVQRFDNATNDRQVGYWQTITDPTTKPDAGSQGVSFSVPASGAPT